LAIENLARRRPRHFLSAVNSNIAAKLSGAAPAAPSSTRAFRQFAGAIPATFAPGARRENRFSTLSLVLETMIDALRVRIISSKGNTVSVMSVLDLIFIELYAYPRLSTSRRAAKQTRRKRIAFVMGAQNIDALAGFGQKRARDNLIEDDLLALESKAAILLI